jgi:hypothetical protein
MRRGTASLGTIEADCALFGGKEGCSFLKKRTKKLLIISASASPDRLSPDSQKFFGSFFQKRTFLLRGSLSRLTV